MIVKQCMPRVKLIRIIMKIHFLSRLELSHSLNWSPSNGNGLK